MEEKMDDKNLEPLYPEKKIYIPPKLIIYGKLTKLTGGALNKQTKENVGQGGSLDSNRELRT